MIKVDINEYKDIWIFAEQRDNKLMHIAFELLGEGHRLSRKINRKVKAVLLGSNVKDLSEELIKAGADEVYVIDDEKLKDYNTDMYTECLSNLIDSEKPEIFLFGASHIGRDLAPRISARVNTGLTADCTNLDIDHESDNRLLQTRPAFGGNIMATIICPESRPQMATIREGIMSPIDNNLKDEILEEIKDRRVLNNKIVDVKFDVKKESNVKLIDKIKEKTSLKDIRNSNVLISGGRGMASKEGFDLLKDLAEKFDGMVSGSRGAVDEGLIDHDYQVGQTGKNVKPDIYFACGISGAIQHTAGMSSSKCVIAINKDPDAEIFKYADIGIVGDVFDIIPKILEDKINL